MKKNLKLKIKQTLFTVFALLLSGGLLLIWYSNQHNAVQAGWSSGHSDWLQRKQLTLTNNSGATLNATAVVTVTVNSKALVDLGKLRSDCNDLRIVHSTAGELTRYVSFPSGLTCSTSTATKVNFPLQTNITNGSSDTNYFLYYYNTGASAPTNNYTAFSLSGKNATFVCNFDNSTTCTAAGTTTPTTETGAIRYSGTGSAYRVVDDHNYAVSTLSLAGLSQLTIEGWFYADKNNTGTDNAEIVGGRISCSGSSWGGGLGNSYGGFGLALQMNDGLCHYLGGTKPSANTWHHIAGVYNGSTLKLYVDGVDQNAQQYNWNSGASTESSYTGTIAQPTGIYLAGWSTPIWTGMMDEVRISNVARYTANFTPSRSPFFRDSNTLILYHFDDNGTDPIKGSGYIFDDSGNGNNATVVGSGTSYASGVVGVNKSSSDVGPVPHQGFLSHQGIFVEEGTTNKITNPSFENSTYDTNWTAGSNLTAAKNTSAIYTHFGSNSAKLTNGGPVTSYTSGSDSNEWIYSATSNKRLGQGFQVASNYSLSAVELLLEEWGVFSGSLQVEIDTDSAGVPSGTAVANGTSSCVTSSPSYWASELAPVNQYVPFGFSTSPSLTSATQYHIVLKVFSDTACVTERSSTTSSMVWHYDGSAAAYASGDRSEMNTSNVWTATAGTDFLFKLWANDNSKFTTSINAGNTNSHTLSAYVFNGGGTLVNATDYTWYNLVNTGAAKLVFNGAAVATTYTNLNNGWWRLTYTAAAGAGAQNYGVEVESNNIYVDGVQLEEKAYATTYADGSLGSGYGWDTNCDGTADGGTTNNSCSARTVSNLIYSSTSNIAVGAGSLSLWIKTPWVGNDSVDHTILEVNTTVGTFKISKNSSNNLIISDGTNSATKAVSWSANTWNYIVMDWGSSNMHVYLNNSAGTAAGAYSIPTLSTSMYIGQDKTNANHWSGVLSDIRLYNAILSSTDVSDLYYAGLLAHSEGAQVDRFDVQDTKAQPPIATWHMDEANGTTTYDSSPYGHNMTISSATWGTDGATGNPRRTYLNFSGSSQYLSRTIDGDFDFGTGSFTLSGWFRHPTTIAGTQVLLSRYGTAGYKVYLNASGYLCFGIDGDSTWTPGDSACTAASLGSLADSKWHHFEAVKSGTSSITLYIDGSSQATDASLVTTGTLNTGSNLYIGIDSDGSSNAYAGSLDDFAIYNYARTATQVKTDAAIGIGGQKGALLGAQTNDPLTNNLVGYWKMDETSGNAADSSGNGNTGTWNGTSGHYVSGKYGGGGYAASGGSDYLNMGTPTNLNISGDAPYTISAWVKPVSALNGPIFSYGGGSRGHVISLIGNSGPIRSVHYSNDHNFVTTWTQNVWQHVVIAYDPTDGVGTEKLYVDGVFMESWNPSNLSITAGEAMYIGRESWSVGNVSTTYIDEVRLYNRALSPGEVSQIYNWTAGPVGFWRFEEGSGTSANDISGNSNTGTITQGGGGYDAGKYGKGYNFDNTSTSINAGSGSTLDDLPATAGMTVEAWINPKGQGENGTGFIVAKNVGTTPSAGWILQLAASYGFTFTVDGGTDLVRTTSTSAISPNTWSHITVTWDGVITTASSVHIFVNGVEASYATTTNGVSRVSDATSSVYIGNDSTGAATFNGTIDEVKIYNYAISQKQIISDYNGGHPIGGSPVGSQAVYYKFDEGYGTAFHDSGPNKMDGVMTGAGWTNQGKFGKALFFNGTSSQYATVTDSTGSALDITGAITISAWIKNNVASGGSLDGGIVYKSPNIFGATNTKVYEIGFLDGIFYWQRGNGAGGDDSLSFTWDLGAGSWHHIVAVWDGTTTSEAMKIYVDGRLKTKGAANIASIRTTNDPLSISGHSGAFSYEFFDGLIDEVKIYSSALSVSQIQQDYNQGKSLVLGNAGINTTDGKTASSSAESAYCVPGDTGTCRPPVGEWTFEDQSSSTSVPDSSGNANTGTWGGTGGKHYTVGKIGNSGQFNGSDDRVDITTSSSLTPSAVSVSAWFNTTSTNGQIIFRKRTGGYGLETGNYASGASAGQVSFWYYDGAVNIHTASSTSTYNDGKWHFAEGTFDGANVIIYVDGIQVGKTASSNGIGYFAGNIGIGRDADYNAGYFTGSIDQVKVFDYGRSTAQAAYDYSRGKSIAWYKFNECTGSNVNDSMGISPVGVISIGGSGSQNATGTCSTTNSAAAWYNGVSGKFNYSLNLDGTDDFVTTTAFSPLAAAAQTTTKVSWGGWFYPTTSAASKTLLEKATEFQLTTDASSKPVCGIYYSGAFHNANSGAKALTLSAWNHVVCTYDGANIKTYLNGGLIDVTANTNAITAASSILYMGETSGGANFYKGQIDDVQIFNYPLTATQVKNVYSQNSAVRWGPLTGAP